MENRLRLPSAESAEEVRKLRTRLQESERRLQETEQQIDELETKNESWRQEVRDAAMAGFSRLSITSGRVQPGAQFKLG